MDIFGVILAGGRSSRLHGTAPVPTPDKPLLTGPSGSLLDQALTALEVAGSVSADQVVVVGPEDLPVPPGVRLTREDPPFSGPAAAIRAGLAALEAVSEPSRTWVFTIAADMPNVAPAIEALLLSMREHVERVLDGAADPGAGQDPDGVPQALIAVEGDMAQPLVALLRLDAAVAAFDEESEGASVRSRLRRLNPVRVPVARGTSADVDTWEDAQRLGFTGRGDRAGDDAR